MHSHKRKSARKDLYEYKKNTLHWGFFIRVFCCFNLLEHQAPKILSHVYTNSTSYYLRVIFYDGKTFENADKREPSLNQVSKYFSDTFFIRVKVSLNLIEYRSNMDVDYVKKIIVIG